MAINRFMKPAEQPLMNTYVRLPFEQLSMAYNQVQKEHDAGEKLAGSLDDKILKVRASTPLHIQTLSQIRGNLDSQLSTLYDKHGGRYADMVPELQQIKNSIDQDFTDGSLFAIKQTTKRKEKKLDKDIIEARNNKRYSEIYNPLFGGERDWYDFYHHGFKIEDGEWVIDEGSTAGWTTMPDGRTVLTPFHYEGIHHPSDQLDEANTKIFDPIVADYTKWVNENPNSGATKIQETKAITRSKIYKSAYENYSYLPDNMRLEIQAEVGAMDGNERKAAAIHAIDAVFGDPAAGTPLATQKEDLITAITNDPNGHLATTWASADYVGYMGEKYTFQNDMSSITYDQSVINNLKYPIPKADWVPKIGATSTIQGGTVRTPTADGNALISETSDPMKTYIDMVDDKASLYHNLINEYELTKANYTLDDPYHTEYKNKINEAKYQYESASMALISLNQKAAEQLGVEQYTGGGGGIRYKGPGGRYVYVPRILANGQVNPEWTLHGWSAIQFDANGDLQTIENINAQATTPGDNIWRYMDQAKGLFNSVASLGGTTTSPLMKTAETIVDNQDFFGGRSTQAKTVSSTGSKKVDDAIKQKLPGILGQSDHLFTLTDGSNVKWEDLVNDHGLSQEVIDAFLTGDYTDNIQWLTNPTPSGTYLGILTLPKSTLGTETIDLLFTAPEEVRRTWRNQSEYKRELGDGSGSTEIITRPRTELEKQDFDLNERAAIDFSRASSIPGNISMSSAEDAENNPLGYYYFQSLPDGTPITNESYVFQPRAGLIKDIVNGEYVYTTGNELFNANSDTQAIGMLITLNDPQYAGAKAFYANQFKTNPNPVAAEGVPVTVDVAEARGVDVGGNNFSTNLSKGQIMLPENRVTSGQLQSFNTENNWAFNSAFEGLNKITADMLAFSAKEYDTNFGKTISSNILSYMANETVTMKDGVQMTFTDAINRGFIQIVPRHNVDGKFSLPLTSGARTYAQQKSMYDAWVDGGKVGPPVANPENGGFHVMGQAVDLSQTKTAYDWILVDKSNLHGGISGIGTQNPFSNETMFNGYDQTSSTVSGVSVANLVKSNGATVFSDFYNLALTTLFDDIGTTKDSLKEYHKKTGAYREADLLPNMKQFDKEWWHWSLGELTGVSSGHVFPSWAN